jgi:hypothetical protein
MQMSSMERRNKDSITKVILAGCIIMLRSIMTVHSGNRLCPEAGVLLEEMVHVNLLRQKRVIFQRSTMPTLFHAVHITPTMGCSLVLLKTEETKLNKPITSDDYDISP